MSTPLLANASFAFYTTPEGTWRVAITDSTNPNARAWVEVESLDEATQTALMALLPALLAAGFPAPTGTP